MRNVRIFFIATTIGLLASCNSNNQNNNRSDVAIPVTVNELKKSSIKSLNTTTGNLVPLSSADIVTLIDGDYRPQTNPATKTKYRIGDKIKSGDVIAKIEDKEYENSIAIESKRISEDIAKGELEKLIALDKKGGTTQNEIRSAELDVANAITECENGEISLEKMSIKSPISGVIVDIDYYTPGVKLTAGTQIAQVMDYSKMYLDIALSESTINLIKKGQNVYVTHYSLPRDTIVATIDELSPAIDSQTRTYKAVVVVNNSDLKLKPGMFVKADIEVNSSKDTYVVPKNIIRTIKDRTVIFVADGATAKEKVVTLGIENGDMIEIKAKELKDGDKIVISGHETLKNNSKIKINK